MTPSRSEGRSSASVEHVPELSDRERTERITHSIQPASEPNSPLGVVERFGRFAAGLRRLKSDERLIVRVFAVTVAIVLVVVLVAGALSDSLAAIL